MYHIILCVCTHKDLQLLVTCIKTHDSESRGQEEAAVRDE